MDKKISWCRVDAFFSQDSAQWKRSAGMDEHGDIYVPAIIAGEEKKIFFDSDRDEEPIAILDDHLFVRSKWVEKNYPDTKETLGKIEKSFMEKFNSSIFIKVALIGLSDTLYIGASNDER